MGVPFCFGDESHSPDLVGAGIDRAREYLLESGVETVTVLDRDGDNVSRRCVRL